MGKREATTAVLEHPAPVARPPQAPPRPASPSRPAISPVVDMVAVSAQADEIFSRPRDTWSTTDLQTARLAASVHPWPRHVESKTLDDKLSRLSILGLQRGRLQEQSGSAADRLAAEQAKQGAADRLAVEGERIRQQQAQLQAQLEALEADARQTAVVVEAQQTAVDALRTDRFQPQHRLDEIAAAEREHNQRFRQPIDARRAEIKGLQRRLEINPEDPHDRSQAEVICRDAFVGKRFVSGPWNDLCNETKARIAELLAEVESLESDQDAPALLARIAELRSYYVPE